MTEIPPHVPARVAEAVNADLDLFGPSQITADDAEFIIEALTPTDVLPPMKDAVRFFRYRTQVRLAVMHEAKQYGLLEGLEGDR